MDKKDNKPCPFCAGSNIQIDIRPRMYYGDCFFEAVARCKDCSSSGGPILRPGVEPSKEEESMLWNRWNRRK